MAQTGAFCQPIEHKDDFYEFHASHVAVCDSHKCAEQLKQLAGAVKLRVVPTTPALVLPGAVIREGATLDPNRDFCQHVASVEVAFTELTDLVKEKEISA